MPGLPDSLEDLVEPLQAELIRITATSFGADPTEWLTDRDLESLFLDGVSEDWHSRYRRLLDAGYTLGELFASMQGEFRKADIKTLIAVGELAQARGHGPGQIDGTDWVLQAAKRLFPHPDALARLGNNEPLKLELVKLVRKDVDAEFQRLEDEAQRLRPGDRDRVRIVRAFLAEYPPIAGMSTADARELGQMNTQDAANLLARYESLRKDGYTLDRLRNSLPSDAWGRSEMNHLLGVMQFPGMPTMNDLVIVGEAARNRKLSPSDEDEAQRLRPGDRDRVRIVRALLAEYPPIAGMSTADARELGQMNTQDAANLLARYESLRKDGYTLNRLRTSLPSDAWGRPEMDRLLGVMQFPGMPTMNDLVIVGEAARNRKLPPSEVDIYTWLLVHTKLGPSTAARLVARTVL